MSTDEQVQANFFLYVDCYLWVNGLTPDVLEYQNWYSSQFTIGQDPNTGYWSIQSWTPSSPSQPAESDLQALTPTQVTNFQKYMDVLILASDQPVIYQVQFDLQNQVRALQSLTPYTDAQYKSYVAGLPFST